jgi:hypothetical protein
MALSKQAQAIIDTAASFGFAPDFIKQTVARLATKRKIPSPGPGEKLVIGKDGTWTLEKEPHERFRKSGEPTPALMNLLKAMTTKTDNKAEQLLKETSGVAMNEVEKRQVLAAVQPEMARSMRAHQHVVTVGRPGARGMIKRAGMTGLSGLSQPQPRPTPTTGLSTTPELEQQIESVALTPAQAAAQFMARRIPREGMPGGMKPTVQMDSYGTPYVPQR